MTKSKKREAKANKVEKDLSIPPFPDPIFVIELDNEILITDFEAKECIYPHYRFDGEPDAAFKAADVIATKAKKPVTDTIKFGSLEDPFTYDPVKLENQNTNLMVIINNERAKIRDNWKKLDEEKKSRALDKP